MSDTALVISTTWQATSRSDLLSSARGRLGLAAADGLDRRPLHPDGSPGHLHSVVDRDLAGFDCRDQRGVAALQHNAGAVHRTLADIQQLGGLPNGRRGHALRIKGANWRLFRPLRRKDLRMVNPSREVWPALFERRQFRGYQGPLRLAQMPSVRIERDHESDRVAALSRRAGGALPHLEQGLLVDHLTGKEPVASVEDLAFIDVNRRELPMGRDVVGQAAQLLCRHQRKNLRKGMEFHEWGLLG